jgi:hypothetical protein
MVDVVEYRTLSWCDRYKIGSDGSIIGPMGRPLIPGRHPQGYLQVLIYRPGQHRLCRRVHALVCEAFHGPRPEGQEVRHLDGNPANNNASNLRWGTHSENVIDSINHGTKFVPRGELQRTSKLTGQDILEIRSSNQSQAELALKYGVTQGHISNIRSRKTWRHV